MSVLLRRKNLKLTNGAMEREADTSPVSPLQPARTHRVMGRAKIVTHFVCCYQGPHGRRDCLAEIERGDKRGVEVRSIADAARAAAADLALLSRMCVCVHMYPATLR
jgi:hypothetical protein